jgi:hypothetical protein
MTGTVRVLLGELLNDQWGRYYRVSFFADGERQTVRFGSNDLLSTKPWGMHIITGTNEFELIMTPDCYVASFAEHNHQLSDRDIEKIVHAFDDYQSISYEQINGDLVVATLKTPTSHSTIRLCRPMIKEFEETGKITNADDGWVITKVGDIYNISFKYCSLNFSSRIMAEMVTCFEYFSDN